MIVRRIAAGSAAAAMLGGLVMAGPTAAAEKPTKLRLNTGFSIQLLVAGVAVKAVEPARFKTSRVALPIESVSRKKVFHSGGLRFTNGQKFVQLEDIVLNTRTGNASATVSSNDIITLPIKNILVVTGGKKTAKSWKKATVSLAESVDLFSNGDMDDPAPLINSLLVDDLAAVAVGTGQRLGKLSSTWK